MFDMDGVVKVYIEWVIVENFLIDGGLLCVSLLFSRQKIVWWRVGIASALGTAFALFFPLLSLPKIPYRLLSFAVGFLLVYTAMERAKGIVFTTGLFYLFSFALAGGMTAICDGYAFAKTGVNTLSLPACLSAFFLGMLFFLGVFKKVYKKNKVEGFIYSCALTYHGKRKEVKGFLDSGNHARAKGRGIVFLDGRIFFELIDENTQFEEVEILTMTGKKRIKLFLLEKMEIYCRGGRNILKRVYCAPAPALKEREYELILSADALEESGGEGCF